MPEEVIAPAVGEALFGEAVGADLLAEGLGSGMLAGAGETTAGLLGAGEAAGAGGLAGLAGSDIGVGGLGSALAGMGEAISPYASAALDFTGGMSGLPAGGADLMTATDFTGGMSGLPAQGADIMSPWDIVKQTYGDVITDPAVQTAKTGLDAYKTANTVNNMINPPASRGGLSGFSQQNIQQRQAELANATQRPQPFTNYQPFGRANFGGGLRGA